MRDALLERLAFLAIGLFGERGEPVGAVIVERAAIRVSGERAEYVARIGAALGATRGDRPGEVLLVVRRRDPELLLERPAQRHLREDEPRRGLLLPPRAGGLHLER